MTSQLSPSKVEEMVKKEANNIVDDKLHSEDVLQELKRKIFSLQLVESRNEIFMKLCKLLQNSTEHNNVGDFYRNYLKNVVLQNQIYFPNVDKYTSRLLLMKLGDIMKVEVSNIAIRITKDGPKVCQRENLQVYHILRIALCISCIKILEIAKTGGILLLVILEGK